MSNENNGGAPGSDLDIELNQWLECANAFGSGQTIVVAAVHRMRAARSETERDSIRAEIRGFCRRLALGMFAIAHPGHTLDDSDPGTLTKGF